jgi:hypothetical protein
VAHAKNEGIHAGTPGLAQAGNTAVPSHSAKPLHL